MLFSRKNPLFTVTVIVADVVSIVAAFSTAYYIRFAGWIIPFHNDIPSFYDYFRAIVVVIPVYLFMFRSYRLYEAERQIRRIYELLNVTKALTISIIFIMALTFIYREFSYSRIVLSFAWLLSILFCCTSRYFLIQFEYHIHRNRNRHRALIVGINQSTRNLISWAKQNPHYSRDIIGIISSGDASQEKHLQEVPILGSLLDLNEVLSNHEIDEVIVADPSLPRETVTDLMLKCENRLIKFKLVADFYGLITHHVDVEYVSNVPLLGLKALPLDDPWNRIVKRSFDIALSGFSLIFLSPFFLIISILIKLTSKGFFIYAQERVGRDGQPFDLYKFRTMVMNAEEEMGPIWAEKNDSRITQVGRFLRRSNLDELPQLWNVLKGEMSLVGPRPERPHFVQRLRDQIPRYMSRHMIKSGLTGWAQIHGLRGNTSLEERIKYDLYYMENWTLMMDVEIIFASILSFKNAY